MTEKKVLIFDMYETLVINTNDLWIPTFNTIVNELGLDISGKSLWDLWKPIEVTFREERYEPGYPFKSYRKAWTECFEKVFLEIPGIRKGAADYAAEMCVQGWSTRNSYPESTKVLDYLKEQGFIIALLSNADIDSIESLINLHKFNFDFVACSEKIQSYKPEESAYNYVLENMKISPESCLYIGDSQYDDVFGSGRVGMDSAWVNRYNNSLNADLPKPKYIIKNLEDLIQILS
ncbi:MAG: HAD family hydrolase [Dehalococcoidia bacterium]